MLQIRSYVLISILSFSLYACGMIKPVDLRPDADSIPVEQAAKVIIPIELDVVYLNRKKFDLVLPYSETVTYYLPTGHQKLGLRYNAMLINEDGNQEVIKSGVIELTLDAIAGNTYEIKYDKPNSFKQAEKMAKAFKAKLYLDKKLLVESKANDLWEIPGAISAVDEKSQAFAENIQASKPDDNESASKHLNYWWHKATAEEKKKFLEMIRN